MLMKLKNILVFAVILGCSGNSNQTGVNPCSKTSAIGSASKIEDFMIHIRVGTIEAELDRQLLERFYGSNTLKATIEAANAQNPNSATLKTKCVVAIFPKELTDDDSYSFWTAEHCLLPSAITGTVKISIKSEDEKNKNYEVRSDLLDRYIELNKSKNFRENKLSFKKFQPKYNTRVRDLIRADPNYLEKLAANNDRKSKMVKEIIHESNEDNMYFGSSLCNNWQIQKRESTDSQKTCFLFQDLFAFEGWLSEGENEKSVPRALDLNHQDLSAIEKTKNFDNQGAKEWRQAIIDLQKAALGSRIKFQHVDNIEDCKDNHKKGSAELDSCVREQKEFIANPYYSDYVEVEGGVKLAEFHEKIGEYLNSEKIYAKEVIYHYIYTEFYEILDKVYEIWNIIPKPFSKVIGAKENSIKQAIVESFSGESNKAPLHYLGFMQESEGAKKNFGIFDFKNLFGSLRATVALRTYGLVLFNSGKNTRFISGDSGSILLFNKTVPIAALSTINDTDSTGGGAATGPTPANDLQDDLKIGKHLLDDNLQDGSGETLDSLLAENILEIQSASNKNESIASQAKDKKDIVENVDKKPFVISDNEKATSLDSPLEIPQTQTGDSDCI